ncbi:MAG: hypothetical protein PHS71_07965 [Proteiniphilum sp.]|nr:hypothetical protein [Proteiniphilum sp.]
MKNIMKDTIEQLIKLVDEEKLSVVLEQALAKTNTGRLRGLFF